MTMLPFQHLFNQQQQKQFYDGYGGCGDSFTESFGFMNSLVKGYDCCIGSDLVIGPIMAEDESRTSSVNEAGSSSKDVQEEKKESWLQLGLGAGYMTNPQLSHDHAEPMAQPKRGLLELDLLPAGSSQLHLKPLVPSFHMTEFRAPQQPTSSTSMITSITNVDTPVFLQHPRTSSLNFGQHEVTWGYRPNPWNPSTAVSSSSSSMPPGPYYPPQVPQPSADMAGSSSILRVIDAPRRPHHSNIWFSLQALQNQTKEPFLPQIPKSYLRIKDGKMTVRVLMKYLVSKLRLNSESEIEITCRGQQLKPFLTLQHVRDTIWSRRNVVTLLSDSSTTDHVMILNYSRSA